MVVCQHKVPVTAEMDIRFHFTHAHFKRLVEGGHRVFGRVAGSATMGDDAEWIGQGHTLSVVGG